MSLLGVVYTAPSSPARHHHDTLWVACHGVMAMFRYGLALHR